MKSNARASRKNLPRRATPRTAGRRPKVFAPVHPGEVILRDYLEPLALSQYALAKALDITQARLGEIVRKVRPRAA